MARLMLRVLGPFQASLDGEELSGFRTKKVQALLVYLASESEPQQREWLLTLLWPGMPETSARANLRQLIYLLRKTVSKVEAGEQDGAGPVIANRQTIQLKPEAVALDTQKFETLIEGTQSHEHVDLLTCHQCRGDLEKAIALYRGDFLTDFYLEDSNEFEAWAQSHREFYRRRALDALETLTTIATRQQAYPEAREYTEQQLEIDNLRESAYRQLMEILALSGHREEALAQYEACKRVLAEELGMAPSARTTEIYDKILAGDLSFDVPLAQGVRGYDLKEEIGEGAYGSIHRAVQPAINREVAVKVIQRKLANNPEFIRRFEAEAQTIARLEHPYIVPLYDYWRDPDGAYLVMRYLRGGNLLGALTEGSWDTQPTLKMVEQIASALSAAHQQGVVHRDIKPANILLDEAGNAFLSDFGIAKDLTGEMQITAEGMVIGTPDYISPEQIRAEPLSPQTDLYSLGMVLYETLTGERPFPDTSVANLLYKHLNEPVPLVGSSRPDLPGGIDEVIQRATAKQPADRYANAMEMAEAFRQAVRGDGALVVTEPESTALPAVSEIYNPYKGLRAFQEADADDFFGREMLVHQLLERLNATGHSQRGAVPPGRFLTVVGPSGSGKSSVVKAGLIPALRAGAVLGSEKWFMAEMVPGSHPLEELEMALWPIAVDPPPSLVEPMERDTRGLLRTIRRIMPDEEGAELLLVVDQFEELFTLVEDEERRKFFIDSLLMALRAPSSPLRVVVTLRADFYDRPLQLQPLGQVVQENTEIVLPLAPEELNWAVRDPARRMGVSLEGGLAEAIVSDVADQPGALPLVQYTMTELFDVRQDHTMTRSAYNEIGGVLGALATRAEMLYKELEESDRYLARQLFLRLVTLGEGVEDTRRRVLWSELEALEEASLEADTISSTIEHFGRARLLTFDHDPITREPTVEVAHEALLREWPRLRDWLEESRDDVRLQRRLSVAAAEWLEAGRDPGFLLRGSRLAQFASWQTESELALTGDERDYLEASLDAQLARLQEEEARRQRELETAQQLAETEKQRAEEQAQAAGRLRRRAVLLTGALVVAGLLAIAAFFFAQQSSANAAEAQENAALAVTRESEAQVESQQRATAQALAETERERANEQRNAALSAEAQAIAEAQFRATAEAEAVLEREVAQQQADLATSRELSLAALNNLELDPELSMLLAMQALNASYTKEAEEALHQGLQSSRVLMTLTDHTDGILDANYSPDGTVIATVSRDGTAKIWEAENGRLLQTLTFSGIAPIGHTVTFDDTGDRISLISAGENNESAILQQWDVASGDLLAEVQLPLSFEIWWLDLSPDLKTVAVISDNGTVELRDAELAERSLTLSGRDDVVYGVLFNSDGSLLVTTSIDGRAQIWDVAKSIESDEGQLVTSIEWVTEATPNEGHFSADSSRLAFTFADSTVEVWNLTDTSQPPVFLEGHTNFALDAAFHPNDILLATAAADGTAKVWDTSSGEELFTLSGHKGFVEGLAFNPDGSRLVTAGQDGTARIWNVELLTDGELFTFATSGVINVMDLELSPDEQTVALGNDAGPATVWDAQTGALLYTLRGEGDTRVYRVSYNPDGSRLATVGEDGVARLWDTVTGELLLEFTAHTGGNSSGRIGTLDVSFSPNGSQLATAGADGIAKVWDAETGEELLAFERHTAGLFSLTYSPDGRYIATSSDTSDSSVKVWDAITGEVVHSFGPNPGRAWGLAFSPDGDLLAAGGQGGYLKVWDMITGKEVGNLAGQSATIGTVAFTPDGQRLLTGGVNSASIWDIAAGTELVNLAPRNSWKVALTQDGRRLFAADFLTPAVRVYTVLLEDAVDLAQSRVTRSLTDAECQQYLHLETCPAEE